ncbi:hypothetical protein [Allorhizobium undicola]|uniref:hypothetical protein n=1 Tax=Allorhizobium undicola TaxID=78527 RepID=UPI000487F9E7|nr:hypothetical protein [Allorhizobium undicola]
MATLPVIPLTTGQRIMGGIALFQPHGSDKVIKIGPVGVVDFAPTLTEVESRSDETGTSQLIGSWITQQDAVITISDIQMWTPTTYDAMFLSKRILATQTALASGTVIVEDVAVGDVLELPGINPSITSVTDGAATPVEYDEDADGFGEGHYIYQSKRKLLEFIAKPAGAGADAEITYSLPAITEADKVVRLEIMKTGGVRGKFTLLGIVDGGLPGKAVDYVFADVEFRPNGNITLKGVDALNVASLTGKVYNTAGQGYGFIRPLD